MFQIDQTSMHKFKHDDQSEYLIHLVGKTRPYEIFMRILSSGNIKAMNSFGFRKTEHQKKAICFSEIPPIYLQKLVKRRYNHGIAFKKDFLLTKGAQRVWYIEKDSQAHNSLINLSNSFSGSKKDLFFNLTPFIDIPGKYGKSVYHFEWEREWRIVGDLSFTPKDVEFLILPSDVHETARSFFYEAELDQVGPNYNCPYYDPLTDVYSKET